MDIKLIFRALKHRNYRLFFTGQVISLSGTWMQMIAMSWLVYRITNSPLLLGLVGFLGQIPSFFLMPFAGVIADRYNRQRILLITQIAAMLQALVLSFLVMTNSVQVWQIVLLSVILGFVNSFDIPVRQAFTIEMIENKEDLGNAIALNSSMVNIARLIGPSIAGIIIATLGEGPCFLLNALSYVAVIISLLMMQISQKKSRQARRHVLHELKEGFVYAFTFIPIKHILILLSLVSLTGVPYQVLMPIFAKDIFHGGPQTLGFLMSMAGLGALMGAIYLAARRSVIGLGRIIALAALCFGIGVSIFSFSKNLWISLLLICFAGFSMMVQMAASNTILQTIVEEDKRGRVMSFYTMSFMGMTPFGSLLAGSLANKIGAPGTLLCGGICCIIGALVFFQKLPLIRKHIRPIYVKKGIIPEEVVRGIGAASGLEVLSEK
ncbi:MAG: MFS transporter [Candidatus Omnitrophica bacterium]|nr:MFS transporter [Candidatus Omnitrophota bacterium]